MGIKISALPTVSAALLTDIVPAVQGGVTSQETLQQILTLFQANIAIKNPVRVATTGALTATYSNGTAGVGATLTNSGALAALTIDGVAVTAADRVLVKDQGSTFQNGIYTVTNAGSAFVAWVLTRATDFDNSPSGEIVQGAQVSVSAGTVNIGSIWIETGAGPFTVGTTPIVFSAVSAGGAVPVASATLVTTAASVPTYVGPMANGQVVIGSTGATPVVANLSAGSGISISSGAGTITISGTGSGIGWTEVTGATQAMVADNGYVANRATLITFTLPATAAFGTAISIIGKGAGGWIIAQNAGQNIQVGSVSSTIGAGGSVASTNRFDSISLICTTANTTWTVDSAPQSAGLTIV